MTIVTKKAYPRAGLLGNPSDGYGGKTLSFTFSDFAAEVTLTTSDQIRIVAPIQNEFSCLPSFESYAAQHGFYGGARLLKSALHQFCKYCRETGQSLCEKNFSATFSSDIPRQVGLAGSSAIITAMLNSLFEWYEVKIPIYLLPALTLQTETALGIPAGFQDRVIQAYQGVVFMDFHHSTMNLEHNLLYGEYQPLNPEALSCLYISYNSRIGEPTEVLHNDLARRFREGDRDVLEAMENFGNLARLGKSAIQNGDNTLLSTLIDRNFDQRRAICQLPQKHIQMIDTAREIGCTAKFCGSGGAIVGTYPTEDAFHSLVAAMNEIGCETFKPTIA